MEVKGGDPLCVLREGSGVALAVVVASDAVTFNDCLAAGLPRGDRIAEMAMLYRQDCSVEFLRASSFHLNVLRDPQPPLTTARALLAARPRAYEISKLNRRADVPHEALVRAAIRGYRQARARGESGGDYLRLDCVHPQRLTEVAAQQDGEAMGCSATLSARRTWSSATSWPGPLESGMPRSPRRGGATSSSTPPCSVRPGTSR